MGEAFGGLCGFLTGEAAGGDEVVLRGEVARGGGGRGGDGQEGALEGEMYGGGGAVEGEEMFLEAEHGGGGRRGVERAGEFGVASS